MYIYIHIHNCPGALCMRMWYRSPDCVPEGDRSGRTPGLGREALGDYASRRSRGNEGVPKERGS